MQTISTASFIPLTLITPHPPPLPAPMKSISMVILNFDNFIQAWYTSLKDSRNNLIQWKNNNANHLIFLKVHVWSNDIKH